MVGDMVSRPGWYANGQKQKEVNYIEGEPDGIWTYWDSTGVITKKQYWDRGAFLRVEELH